MVNVELVARQGTRRPKLQFLRRQLASCLVATAMYLCVIAPPSAAQEKIMLVGSGSNVTVPLYQNWTSRFSANNDYIQVHYLALGSSEAIRQISSGVGDFAGGEILLTDAQMHGSKVSLMMVPTVLVAIVPIYNLPGNPELNFSGDLLAAQIYLGKVKHWNDPEIAKLNPGVQLPDLPIQVLHRSSGKGSSFIFTDFLSKTNLQFRVQVGRSASPRWPLGVDAERGPEEVEMVRSTQGAIGYVDVSFARNSGVSIGRVQNAAGQFVVATTATVEAACTAVQDSLPTDFRLSMTNAPGKESYPLASFTWIYVPTSGTPLARRRALKQFLIWSLQNGEDVVTTLGYAPLPSRIIREALAEVNSLP